MALRVRTFEHIHGLSIAAQSEEKRGVFVARVTADVDTLSQFTEWGGIAWIVSFAQILRRPRADARLLVAADDPGRRCWSSRCCASCRRCRPPVGAFDLVRARVGQMLSEVSESVMGAAVVRAYGLEDADRHRG